MITIDNIEPLPILFTYNNLNNGYLYLVKFLTQKYNTNFNDLKKFKLTNIDINCEIKRHENLFFFDLKRIKYVEYENLFKILDLILIKNNNRFLKYDFNIFIFMNLNYINHKYISKLSLIVEKNQQLNNMIFFSSNTSLNNHIFKKLKTLSICTKLNPFTELGLNLKKYEIPIFNLLNKDIIKFKLFMEKMKKEKIQLHKLKAYFIFDLVCQNITLINILNKYLLTKNIHSLLFKLITLYQPIEIVYTIKNMIYYINKNNITSNKLFFKDKEKAFSQFININKIDFDTETGLISVKKYINEINALF